MINNMHPEAIAQAYNHKLRADINAEVLRLIDLYVKENQVSGITTETITVMLKLKDLLAENIENRYKSYVNIKLKLVNALIWEEISRIDSLTLKNELWGIALNTGAFRTDVDFFEKLQIKLTVIRKDRLFTLMIMRALTVNERGEEFLLKISARIVEKFQVPGQLFVRLDQILKTLLDDRET